MVITATSNVLNNEELQELISDYDNFRLTDEDLDSFKESKLYSKVLVYRDKATQLEKALQKVMDGSYQVAQEVEENFHECYKNLSADDYFKRLAKSYGDAIEIMDITEKDEVVGREDKLVELSYILNKPVAPVGMLLAPAGAGKTALMKAWKLYQDKLGKEHVQVVALTMMKLSNGGDMADRIQRIIPSLKHYEDKLKLEDPQVRVVLFIDEAHTLVSAFDVTGVTTKLGGELLKTVLTNCPIRVVGATTQLEYETYIASDPALARRFEILQVPLVGKSTTRMILRKFLIKYGGEEFKYSVSDDVLNYIIDGNRRYRMTLAEPAKSLQIIENAFAIYKTDGTPISKAVVDRVFASKNISLQQRADFKRIRDVFRKRIIGQPLALLKIEMAITNMVIPTKLSDRPQLAVLLTGSTGVGKTATVKALAEALKGSRDAFHTFDMSVYTGAEGKERFQNRLGQIADNDPEAIILFDELEKALENQTLLLQVLDEGRISYFVKQRDGGNEIERTISLKGTKIFATTNAGHRMFDSIDKYTPDRVAGMTNDQLLEEWVKDEIDVAEAIQGDGFRSEVYNRFSDVIPYYPLERKSKVKIARSMLEERMEIYRDRYDIEITLPAERKWGTAYEDIGRADAISMFFGVEKQQGKGTTNGGARDIEKSIEQYFDYAIKAQMLEFENTRRFTVSTNGLCNFEQNTSYELERNKALAEGQTEEEFEKSYTRNFKNRAGKIMAVPYTYSG